MKLFFSVPSVTLWLAAFEFRIYHSMSRPRPADFAFS
jgi:hypothetical protein